jgi:hypothetical protein
VRHLVLILLSAVSLLIGSELGSAQRDLGGEPLFDPLTFFTGHVRSWGVMEDRSGAPTGWIVTDCQGQPDGANRLHMTQHLTFQAGPAQDRTWTMSRIDTRHFEATANDMVGSATGDVDGRTFHWRWVLAPAPGERAIAVTMEQWMYRLDDGSVMIRSTVSKLGVILSEVSEVFRPV